MSGEIVLYDGYCNLCSRTVDWIVKNDVRGRFSFEPLQGTEDRGTEDQGTEDRGTEEPGTVVLLSAGRRYERSTAALRIALGLRFPWPALGLFLVVPRFLRDPVYDFVARRRKRWFGTRDTCYLPSIGKRAGDY